MVHAFVLVKANVGEAPNLTEQVRAIDEVTEAHVVAGDWDLVVELEAPEVYDLLNATAEDVQGIDGVVDTKTYVSLED